MGIMAQYCCRCDGWLAGQEAAHSTAAGHSQAIRVLICGTGDQGIAVTPDIARNAVMNHVFPHTHMTFFELYVRAMESGFHVAVLGAALASIAAMALLATVRLRPEQTV